MSNTSESNATENTGHALIELENVAKYYGNIIALQGVTTQVNAGEVTCVLGDNGAGKSRRSPACTSMTKVRSVSTVSRFVSRARVKHSTPVSPRCTKISQWSR